MQTKLNRSEIYVTSKKRKEYSVDKTQSPHRHTFSIQSVDTSQFTKKRTYDSNAKKVAISIFSFTMLGRIEWIKRLPMKSVILYTGKYALGRQWPKASSTILHQHWSFSFCASGGLITTSSGALSYGLPACLQQIAVEFGGLGRYGQRATLPLRFWQVREGSLMLSLTWFPSCRSSNCQQRINNCCTICPLNFISIIAFFGNFCGE